MNLEEAQRALSAQTAILRVLEADLIDESTGDNTLSTFVRGGLIEALLIVNAKIDNALEELRQ